MICTRRLLTLTYNDIEIAKRISSSSFVQLDGLDQHSTIGQCDVCHVHASRVLARTVIKDFTVCDEHLGRTKDQGLHQWTVLRSIRASILYNAGNFPVDPAIVASRIQQSGEKLQQFHWFNHELPSIVSHSIVKHSSRLTTLNIPKCRMDDIIWDIISANQHIAELQLSGNCSTPNVAKLRSALSGTNVTQLGISGGDLTSDSMLLLMLKHMPNLRTLKATDFINETLLLASIRCPKITHLYLSDEYNRVEMNDETFVSIISNLHNIQSIRVNCEGSLTEKSLTTLAALHGHSLTYLDLYLSPSFPVPSVVNLINSCKNLQTLLFSSYSGRDSMSSILAGIELRNIQHLHMHCGVDEGGLASVLRNFPVLVTFGCWLNHSTSRLVLLQARHLITQCKTLKAFYTPQVWSKDPCAGFMAEFASVVNTGCCPELDIFTFPA